MFLLDSLKAAYSKLRSLHAMTVYQFITYFTGIVAFVTAAQYFSEKPSISVTVKDLHGVYVNPGLVQEFYSQAEVDIPEMILKHDIFDFLFDKSAARDNAFIDDKQLGWGPIRSLAKSPPISVFIEDLEKALQTNVWHKTISSWSSRGGVDLEKALENLEPLKTKLSARDYRNFLAAVLYGRVFQNSVYLENDGDIDLKRILITIRGPLAKTTDNRKNNILFVQSDSIHANDITKLEDRVEAHVLNLKRRHGFRLVLHTRENAITEDDVNCSYEESTMLSEKRITMVGLLTLLFMLIVGIVCRGVNKNRH
jgi:hypothetical protein